MLVSSGRAGGSSGPAFVIQRGHHLEAISFDGSRVVRLRFGRSGDPAVSRDGKWLAFTAQRTGRAGIWISHPDGTKVRFVVNDGSEPTWAPGTQTIYFVRFFYESADQCGSIYRIGSDGHGLRRVTRAPHFHDHLQPAVSPDGRSIAFSDWRGCSGGDSSPRLRVVNPAGRRTTDLAKLAHNGYKPADPEHGAPAWSPGGNTLAFITRGRVSISRRDGTRVRFVTPQRLHVADSWTRPAWSPDGHWIAFVAYGNRDDRTALYVVHPDGTALRRVSAADWSAAPAWLPNGMP
jgi:Tol biopolymer transport system component